MDGFLPTFIRRRPLPPRNAEKLAGRPSRTLAAPRAVIVPLQDAPGDPYRCLVKAREGVAAGQKIGEKGPFALAVRAPVSGKVREVDSFPTPHGFHAACVAIDSEGAQGPIAPLEARGRKRETLLEAGVPLDYALLSGGGEINLTEMTDDALLQLVRLDLHAALKE